MNDFKVGDRVTYVGSMERNCGKTFTVKAIGSTRADVEEDPNFTPWFSNLRHAAPDAITIDRADLPEVSERDGRFWAGSGPEECMANGSENPNWLRGHAKSALALAEFLEARERAAEEAAAAEKEAAKKLIKRRDELAELFSGVTGTCYVLRNRDLRNAVDYIIELEANRA